MLKTKQFIRYERQVDLPDFGEEKQSNLLKKKVVLIGAGGLGTPVSLYLCAAGIGHLTIIDNDTVSLSNLHRQILYKSKDIEKSKALTAKQILDEYETDCTIEAINQNVTEKNIDEFLSDTDIVIDATDNFTTRYMLNHYCMTRKIPYMSGSSIGFQGMISLFKPYEHGEAACYQCVFPAQPKNHEAPSCSEGAVLGTLTGVIGTLMATEVIKELINVGTSLSNFMITYNSKEGQFFKLKLHKSSDCPICKAV